MDDNQKEIARCSLIKIYHLLGKKWSLPILHSFIDDNIQSYNSIQRKFNKSINPTILSNRLKSFELYGIILRTRNGYHITGFGLTLINLLHILKDESIRHNLFIPIDCTQGSCVCDRFFFKEKK